MIYILLITLVCTAFSGVVVNPITGLTQNNLAFSGSLPISDSSSDGLFFTYYGKTG